MNIKTLIEIAVALDSAISFTEYLKQNFSANDPVRYLIDTPPQHYLRIHGLILRLSALQYPRPAIREIERAAMEEMKASVNAEIQWADEISDKRKLQLADKYMQAVVPALIDHLNSITNPQEIIRNYKLWSAEKR